MGTGDPPMPVGPIQSSHMEKKQGSTNDQKKSMLAMIEGGKTPSTSQPTTHRAQKAISLKPQVWPPDFADPNPSILSIHGMHQTNKSNPQSPLYATHSTQRIRFQHPGVCSPTEVSWSPWDEGPELCRLKASEDLCLCLYLSKISKQT